MRESVYTDEDFNLWLLLFDVTDVSWKVREKKLAHSHISATQAHLLLLIDTIGDGATPAKIMQWHLRAAPSVAEALNRMERRGLLRKSKDLEKRNLVRVSLTEEGRKAFDETKKRESIHRVTSCLSGEERQQLRSCLSKLRDKALNKFGGDNNESLFTDEDSNLWLLLNHARDTIWKARRKELANYGISLRQAALLFMVHHMGDRATPPEITRWQLRAPHSVAEAFNRMEKAGLVTKTKDLERKNLVRVTLTERGRKVSERAARIESIHRIMSCLSGEERQQLSSSLEKLRDKTCEELGIEYMRFFPPK